ncbi:MAG: autotransporter assembly complex protein TamA [Oligoflexus sp.]
MIFPAILQAVEDEASSRFELCPGITVETEEYLRLTEPEQILVCSGVGQPPYNEVTWNQQQYFLRNFLHDRGFFQFKMERTESGRVRIDLGPRSVIREVRLVNTPYDLQVNRFWKIFGRDMTPDALNQLESWLNLELSRSGYPCANVNTKAYPLGDEVIIDLGQPSLMEFSEVEMELIPGTIGGVERRFNAFHRGDRYDSMLLDLTVQRMINDELVISANYNVNCQPEYEEVHVRLQNIAGKPRLVTFGLGFDTEEFFIVEGAWRNNRMGEMASRLEASVRASFREQRAFIGFDWFYAPMVIRHSIRSQLTAERLNEPNFESNRYEARTGPAWTWDTAPNLYDLWGSVAFDQVETLRGEGPGMARAIMFRLDLSMMSHDYEYFLLNPRSGYRLGSSAEFSAKAFGSDYSATRLNINGAHLWNLFDLEPAVWILGLRGQLTTIDLGRDTTPDEFPTNRRLRLGGSQNLRGFGRQKLPGDGALTSAYLGAELRIREVIPYNIQPILFYDFGRIGLEGYRLENANFWSPGFGVHWDTMIGTFRASLAHGFVSGELEDQFQHLERWQAYLSYGEQF